MNTAVETFDSAATKMIAGQLRSAGYSVQVVDSSGSSPSPDLIVRGSPSFWAEVKELGDPTEFTVMDRAREYLKPRLTNLRLGVDLYVDESATAADYKRLCRLITENAQADNPANVVFVAASNTFDIRARYSLVMQGGARLSYDGFLADGNRIIAPWWSGEPRFGQEFDVVVNRIVQRRMLRNHDDTISIAASLRAAETTGGLFSTAYAGGAWSSTDGRKLRRDVGKANRQISAACKTEELPGVVFLVGRIRPRTLTTSMLGDMMAAISTDPSRPSQTYIGPNGILRRNQNTHVSAVYAVDGDEVTFLANPFARIPVVNFLKKAKVVTIDDQGMVAIP